MRLLRPRFGLKQMMFAVAIVGLALGIHRMAARRSDFLTRAEVAADRASDYRNGRVCYKLGFGSDELTKELGDYHTLMASKYRFLARHPWLPDATDPTEPD